MDDADTPDPKPATAVQAVLRLATPRQRTMDDHMYGAPGIQGGNEAVFRLQLFTAPGARPVAVATQARNEGMSLTNGAESFAATVWQRHFPDQELPPVWIQRSLHDGRTPWPDRFELVTFAEAHPYELCTPSWRTITPEQLELLVGVPVVEDRGSGYRPRPAAPEPEARFVVMAVARLARPRPFRAPACMPGGIRWWRRWVRQALPRRGGRDCCWYHGGDWHQVSAMARKILAEARDVGIDAEDTEDFAREHAIAAGASAWQLDALATLFNTAWSIQPSKGGYINGQHRAQAMLDAGVRRTVVLREQEPPAAG